MPSRRRFFYRPLKSASPNRHPKPAIFAPMFQAPFSFIGRIGRLEYAVTYLISLVVNMTILSIPKDGMRQLEASLLLLAFMGFVWFVVAQTAKRCHDIGRSGWWQLLPLYNVYLLFAQPEGNNEYGPASEPTPPAEY